MWPISRRPRGEWRGIAPPSGLATSSSWSTAHTPVTGPLAGAAKSGRQKGTIRALPRHDRPLREHRMKVLELGGGVIGVTTADFLSEAGHEVSVYDRQLGPALETSFANAGEVSPGYASPL